MHRAQLWNEFQLLVRRVSSIGTSRDKVSFDHLENVPQEVVKQRNEERRWFENEGFGYALVYMNGRWYIRIKPFYMFTGADAKTPLPSFAWTAKATRRMKFDKNKNVERTSSSGRSS